MNQYRQNKVTLNDIDLVYLQWQSINNSENILMLHGMGDNSLVWLKLGDFFSSNSDKYNLIAPDLRGHGNSSKPDTGYFYHNYLQDFKNLYQHLNWDKAHIIAHSWSAKLACLWATKFPEYCQSLTLVDPFFINSIPSVSRLTFPLLYRLLPFLKLTQNFESYSSAEKVAKTLKQYRGWTSWQRDIFTYNMVEKSDGYWSSKFSKNARNEIFEDVIRQKGLTSVLDIPSLLVLPKQGLNRTSWQIKPYRQYLPNLTINYVQGNHWAFIVEPDAFNVTVFDFFHQVNIIKHSR